MFDEERHVASNGTSRPYTNGKAQQRSQPGASANGTHKPAVTLNGSSKSRALEDYFGHDREEITRILIQTLSDMGYRTAAESVSRESGFNLESPTVAAFRSAILEGSWSEAEQLLSGASISGERAYHGGNGLVLANGADRNLMRFWIRQQKFLELLENRATSQALGVLRTELTPLYQDVPKLHFLSSLIMCQTREDLLAKAGWDGAYGRSRQTLLSELSSKWIERLIDNHTPAGNANHHYRMYITLRYAPGTPTRNIITSGEGQPNRSVLMAFKFRVSLALFRPQV